MPNDREKLDILSLYYSSPIHRKYSFERIGELLSLACNSNQYIIVYKKGQPVGFATWTYLTKEDIEKLGSTGIITKDIYNTGNILFIADFICNGISPIRLVTALHKKIPYRGPVFWRRTYTKKAQRKAYASTRKIAI